MLSPFIATSRSPATSTPSAPESAMKNWGDGQNLIDTVYVDTEDPSGAYRDFSIEP